MIFKPESGLFSLMHKNDTVATLQIDLATGSLLKISKVFAPELLPFGGRQSHSYLRKWWEYRAIPSTRNGIQAVLNCLDISSTLNRTNARPFHSIHYRITICPPLSPHHPFPL